MKDLLHFILKELIGEDFFEITEESSDNHTDFQVKVDQDKLGIVIGKDGHTIKSIQDVLRVRGKMEEKTVYIKVEER